MKKAVQAKQDKKPRNPSIIYLHKQSALSRKFISVTDKIATSLEKAAANIRAAVRH